jgi:hypothetical protein
MRLASGSRLPDFKDSYPAQRSGGMKQCAAISRFAAMHESVAGTFAPWRWPPEVVSYLGVKQSD